MLTVLTTGRKKTLMPYVERKLQPECVVVWCGMTSQHLIGPYFFPSTVSAESYLCILRSFLIPSRRRELLNRVPFQRDGAAPRTAQKVLNYLLERFQEKFISFKTDTIWPPHSPDLDHLDCFLWGHLKQQMKGRTWDNMDDLKNDMTQAIRKINRDKDLLRTVIRSFRSCLTACLKDNGGHFHHKR